MPHTARTFAVSLALVVLAMTACSSEMESATCAADAQCPQGSRCDGSVCAANTRPSAAIDLPGVVEEFALVQFDGSRSADPDADDSIRGHAWSIRAISAHCSPPEVTGDGSQARVRFGCPGRFAVGLVVWDRLGMASDPASVEIDVTPATGTRAVLASPDVATDHECTGNPLVCRPVDPLNLSATLAAQAKKLHWSVEPPLDRPLDETRRVSFSPGPDATSPSVSIESDGSAISGDWIFRVEARDEYGVVGAAYTRVSIRNRSPVVMAEAPAEFPHVFDAARSLFTSSGEVTYAAYDPDGDPLELAAIWRHAGDGGARFGGALLGDRATFGIQVPRTSSADALFLRGGPSLERTIEVVARDANGATGSATVPIVVGNRPPTPAAGAAALSRVPHVFDPAGSRYLAVAPLGGWIDPDGDPLSASGGTAPCERVDLVDGVAQVVCAVPFEGTPAVDRIARRHAIPLRVSDGWAEGPVAVHTLEVLNSAPQVAAKLDAPPVACHWWLGLCSSKVFPETVAILSATSFEVAPSASDPDGDPVAVTPLTPHGGTASPSLAVCRDGPCFPIRFELPELKLCPGTGAPAGLRATDGVSTVEIATFPQITGC